jgi:hypothetical protein
MTGHRRPGTWVTAAVVIVLATACGEKASPEAAALADVIRRAQTAELNMDPVPDHVQTTLAKYYVGAVLARKVTQYQNGIRAMAEAGRGGRVGGVKTLDLRDVRVWGKSANVKAEVTVWFKTAQFWYEPVTSQPLATNVIDLDLHLVKDAGTWKIDQELRQFAPGGGP